jgi:23S rRNA (uracil1939-C5)-methyltransferase
MVKDDFFTAPVECLATGGAGIARVKGQTVFVDYTAPGDLVSGRVTETHKTWARAELEEVLEPSADRISPACPLYRTCGGCSLQHLVYAAQLREKEGILRDTLTRIGGITGLPPIKAVPSPEYGYRNRVRFHMVPGTGRAGFKARKSEKIIPLADCPVADKGIRQALAEGRIPAKELRFNGNIGFSVYSRGGVLLCEGKDGPAAVRLLDRDILMGPGVFFQSNAVVLEKLLPDLLALADRADPALPAADIYCGVGTFAAFLQERFPRIDLVEADKVALELARQNVRGEGRRYFPLSDEAWVQNEVIRKIRRAGKDGPVRGDGAYGFAVVDPPRPGLSPSLRRWLAEAGPSLLAYVSCDPATLARDSVSLRAGGYRLESAALYDFYPQTAHIETLAVFIRPAQR